MLSIVPGLRELPHNTKPFIKRRHDNEKNYIFHSALTDFLKHIVIGILCSFFNIFIRVFNQIRCKSKVLVARIIPHPIHRSKAAFTALKRILWSSILFANEILDIVMKDYFHFWSSIRCNFSHGNRKLQKIQRIVCKRNKFFYLPFKAQFRKCIIISHIDVCKRRVRRRVSFSKMAVEVTN